MNRTDALSVLGCGANSSEADVRQAYRRLALKWHPDKNNGDGAMFVKIQEAYQCLKGAVGGTVEARPDYKTFADLLRRFYGDADRKELCCTKKVTLSQVLCGALVPIRLPRTKQEIMVDCSIKGRARKSYKKRFPKGGPDGKDFTVTFEVVFPMMPLDAIQKDAVEKAALKY